MSDRETSGMDRGRDNRAVRGEATSPTRRGLRDRWRSIAPFFAMFVLGAASGIGAYLITDFMSPGTSYCVVSPRTSELHDRHPGDLVAADSGCSPGEVGPICGLAKRDASGRVVSFESQRCSDVLF